MSRMGVLCIWSVRRGAGDGRNTACAWRLHDELLFSAKVSVANVGTSSTGGAARLADPAPIRKSVARFSRGVGSLRPEPVLSAPRLLLRDKTDAVGLVGLITDGLPGGGGASSEASAAAAMARNEGTVDKRTCVGCKKLPSPPVAVKGRHTQVHS